MDDHREVPVNTAIIQIIAAGLAGCGFAVIFHIRAKVLPFVFIGAALSWIAYLLADQVLDVRTTVMIAAAMAVTIYSEIGARVLRMPVSVIYTPSIIPLIPGSHLYYSIRGFVTNTHEDFIRYGGLLLEDTLGIVLGSIIVLTFVSALAARKRRG